MTEKLDLDALEALANAQLVQCGSCDFGLVEYGCTCPKGDPRHVISQLLDALKTLRYNITSGRLTCDISAALRRLAEGRPEIASILAESADQLDDLITSLERSETARDIAITERNRYRERRDKAIKRLTRYKADTFLSEQIIAILTGPDAEAQWYAKYDIKPSGEL